MTIFALPNQLTSTKIMKSIRETNIPEEKGKSLTLKGYYKRLPDPTFPKRDFVQKIAMKCNVTLTTVSAN